MIKTILFDLDGTITDSGPGITNSVEYALTKYGIPVTDRSVLNKFVGPPLSESFEKYFGFSKEESYRAVDVYREYYSVKGIFENALYPNVKEMLERLHRNGYEIILSTSKPEIFAVKILDHFDILKYFTVVCGSELDGRRVDKYEVITESLSRANITECNSVIMIGDRLHDVLGAHKAGIKCVGVTYGYGSREELVEHNVDYIIDDASQLPDLLNNL